MNWRQFAVQVRNSRRYVFLFTTLVVTLAFLARAGNAQQLTGSVTGTVYDQSGAVVPHAHVTLRNEKSGDTRATVSGGGGHFVFAAVQPATYSVTITASGFKTLKVSDIVVSVGASVGVPNIKLTVGHVSQKVTVIGGGPASVPTNTPTLSQTLNEQAINNFPLIGRDAGELFKVMPGMGINSGGNQGSNFNDQEVGSNNGPVGAYASNGTMPYGTTAYMLDGADIVDPGNFGTQIANINPDMISSVKLLLGNYSAKYAYGPTIFEAFSRSGGLQYHGEAYLYARNSALDSVDAYTKSQGGTNAAQHYDYIGGSVGGPVRLPFTHFNTVSKKLFFWFGYEYMLQQPAGSIHNYNVPNTAQRSGDFSNTGISAAAIQAWPNFYNQLTKNLPPGGTATSFPVSDIDPNIKGVLNLYPTPNETPSAANGYHNYKYVQQTPQNRWEASGKIDYSLNDNTKLTGSYTFQHEADLAPISIWWADPETLPYPTPGASNTNVYIINTNLTHVFNSTTTNETVFSWSHFVNPYKLANPNAVARKTVQFNVPGLFGNTTSQMPNFYAEYCCNASMASFNYYPMSTGSFGGIKQVPAFYDNFTKLIGDHTIGAGFYWDDSENSQNSNAPDNGSYYVETYGQNSTTNLAADLMLGYINNYQQQNKDYPNDTHFRQVAFYLQDSWQATRKLNLNYGIRFEHLGQWSAIGGGGPGFQVFSMKAYEQNPTANNAGLLWHATDSSIPLSGFVTPPLLYSPRVGFAYDIFGTGKTVVRGGFGVYRFQATSETASAQNGPLGSFGYTTPTPFDGYANVTTFTPPSAVAQNGSNVYAMQMGDNREPYTNDWNFTIDQALPYRSLLQIAYVGNRTANEYMDGSNSNLYNLNNVPVGAMFKPDPITGQYISPAAPPCSTTDPNSESLYCQNDPAAYSQTFNSNDFRPLQTYQNVFLLTHAPYSNYNGLQITFTKETGPVTLIANYTFSKALGIRDGGSNNGTENGSGTDPFNLRNNYGPLSFDHTQIINFAYNWNLPRFVRGEGFGRRLLEGAVNGWQLSGYTAYQSGSPMQPNTGGFFSANYPSNLTVPTVAHPNLPDNSITLPDGLKAVAISPSTYFGTNAYKDLVPTVTCNPTAHLHNGQRFNPACFGPPAQGQNGDYNLPYIHAPAYVDSDLGIYKNFHFTKDRYVQFRVSAANWLNHPLPQFGLAGNGDESLNFTGTENATCAGCVDSNGQPLTVQYLSPTNTNPQTTGKPAFKTGSRIVTFAAKYYF